MSIDRILVSIGGIAGIIFVFWYFFMKKETIVEVSKRIDILVKGGYEPSTISIPYGKKTEISFLRKDKNTCLEDVVLADFKIKKSLPINERVVIEITPYKKGVFDFSCGMGMFHGKLIVE